MSSRVTSSIVAPVTRTGTGARWTARRTRSGGRLRSAGPTARVSSACAFRTRRTPIEPMRQGRSGGVRPIDFFRHRQGGSNGGGSYNFTVEFSQPVRGPIALGFACHYGLGLFVPSV